MSNQGRIVFIIKGERGGEGPEAKFLLSIETGIMHRSPSEARANILQNIWYNGAKNDGKH